MIIKMMGKLYWDYCNEQALQKYGKNSELAWYEHTIRMELFTSMYDSGKISWEELEEKRSESWNQYNKIEQEELRIYKETHRQNYIKLAKMVLIYGN